jgi:hypothetical protein
MPKRECCLRVSQYGTAAEDSVRLRVGISIRRPNFDIASENVSLHGFISCLMSIIALEIGEEGNDLIFHRFEGEMPKQIWLAYL